MKSSGKTDYSNVIQYQKLIIIGTLYMKSIKKEIFSLKRKEKD